MDDTNRTSQTVVESPVFTVQSPTEEEVIFSYYQMLHHPDMKALLGRYDQSILSAIQRRDMLELTSILEKVREEYLLLFQSKPIQVQESERTTYEDDMRSYENEDKTRAQLAAQSMDAARPAAEGAYTKRRAFIEKLVGNYAKSKPTQEQTQKIVDIIESNPTASFDDLVLKLDATDAVEPDVVKSLARDAQFRRVAQTIQSTPIVREEKQFIHTILSAPVPSLAGSVLTLHTQTMAATETTQDIVSHVETVSTANILMDAAGDPTVEPDFRSFFRDIASHGNAAEKFIAPLADAVMIILPKQLRETVAASVVSSLVRKEVSADGPIQQVLGTLLGSDYVGRLVQKQNAAVFRQSTKGTLLTPAQLFIGDVITTVFKSRGATLPLRALVQTGSQEVIQSVPQLTVYQYYILLSTRYNTTYALKYGASKLGEETMRRAIARQLAKQTAQLGIKEGVKTATAKVTGKSLGQVIGGLLGTALPLPPIVSNFIGSIVGGALVDKIFGTIGKIGSFLSLRWMEGILQGEVPFFKQEGALVTLILVGSLLVITLFPLFGQGAIYQKLVDDNTFIQALGSGPGGGVGPTLDCLGADKDKPECDLTPCDPSKQDCRWPTIGTVVQGPQTTGRGGACPGTHAGAQAIDIDPIGGDTPPVYATINGSVTDLHFGCMTDTGCEGCTCANYVVITGSSYSVGYWHLANIQMVQINQTVRVGDVVGIMDHTGHSTGTHLHYEYWGSGGISSILPTPVPTCNNFAGGSCPCPVITTGVTE